MKLLIPILLALVLPNPAHAAVPGFLPYSGRLTDGSVAGASTTANLRVLLYTCACASDAPDSETCTTATRCVAGQTGLWFEGLHANVPVVDGYFSLMVGMYDAGGNPKPDPANSALTPKLPLPERLWITVSVNGMPELSPRQAIGSVPYALVATNAGTAGRLSTSASASIDAASIWSSIQLYTYEATCQALVMNGGFPTGSYGRLMSINEPSTTAGSSVCDCVGVFSIYTAQDWIANLNGSFATSMGVRSCANPPGAPPAAGYRWAACCRHN